MSKDKNLILNYSIFALPLAFVGMPIYINISDFYAKRFELNLEIIGFSLILVRILDLAQDLLIGYASDLIIKKGINRKKIIYYSSFLLAISFFLLFNPPKLNNQYLVISWFFILLSSTYLFFNFCAINYEAIPAIISKDKNQRISYYSSKELFALIGILLASIAPFAISDIFKTSMESSFFYFSIIFAILIFLSIKLFLNKIIIKSEDDKIIINKNISKVLMPLKNEQFRFIIVIFLVNSIAVSIPSATVIFYVESVLQSQHKLGAFLSIYFLSAIIFMPVWKGLAQKYGKINCWSISIFGSVATFVFAYFLDNETANYFYLVCLMSGLFLGPDLIVPQSIIADIVSKEKGNASSYFAISNMTTKFGLMVASSSSLIILGLSNYKAGQILSNENNQMLPIVYAIIPSIIKLLAVKLIATYKKRYYAIA